MSTCPKCSGPLMRESGFTRCAQCGHNMQPHVFNWAKRNEDQDTTYGGNYRGWRGNYTKVVRNGDPEPLDEIFKVEGSE